jgi:hypothetical protein
VRAISAGVTVVPSYAGSDVWGTRPFQALWGMGLILDKGVQFQTTEVARRAGGTSAYMVEYVTEGDVRSGGCGACADADDATQVANAAATRSFDEHMQQRHGGVQSLFIVAIVRVVVQLLYRLVGVVDDLAMSASVSDVAMNLSNFPAAFAVRWATCRRFLLSSAELTAAKAWHSFKMDLVVHLYERVGGVNQHRFAGYAMLCAAAARQRRCGVVTLLCCVVVPSCSDTEWQGFSTVAFSCREGPDKTTKKSYTTCIRPDGLMTVCGEAEDALAVMMIEEKANTVGHDDGKDMYVRECDVGAFIVSRGGDGHCTL